MVAANGAAAVKQEVGPMAQELPDPNPDAALSTTLSAPMAAATIGSSDVAAAAAAAAQKERAAAMPAGTSGGDDEDGAI